MSKATDILGGAGSVVSSAIGAWNGVNPITGISETANNINMLGNTQYAPGDLTNLSNQFVSATNIQTNGLLNRQNETFGQLFASGLDGMQAGYQLGNAIQGAADASKEKAYGGHLHSLGGDIGALVGAVVNPTLMAISGAVQDNKLNKLSDQFNVLSNAALQRNVQNFSNVITDSTNMMFDNKAIQTKAYGGPLGCFWDTFDNGVRYIKNGGTHEQNPHDGVPQGIAPDGLPNLVEEGEVIFNDFVYSDRLKLTKEQAEQFKLGGEMSYAQAALKLSKESEERPNDMISKNGLKDSMNKLKVMQEKLKAKNDEKKLKREINKLLKNLPVIEEQSIEDSTQNVEVPMDIAQQPMFAKGGHLFAQNGYMETLESLDELLLNQWTAQNKKNKLVGQLPLLSVSSNLDTSLDRLNNIVSKIPKKTQQIIAQPQQDEQKIVEGDGTIHYLDENGNIIATSSPAKTNKETPDGEGPQPLPKDALAETMRMAPFYGSLIQAMQAASVKPNYQHQDAAIRAASQIPYVNYTPIGNYTRYDRIDPNSQANALRAQYAQALSNMQNSGASRAAVNALQTNALQGLTNALSEAAQTGLTYNNTLLEKEAATKNAIDQALMSASLQSSGANQTRANSYATMVGQMAAAKQNIDDIIEANKQTTQTGIYNNLGLIGADRLNRQMQQWMIERGVYPGVAPDKAMGGKLKYKTYRKKK